MPLPIRPSDLAALRETDIATAPGGQLITTRGSKTDADAHGVTIGIAERRRPATEAVRALAGWRHLRSDAKAG